MRLPATWPSRWHAWACWMRDAFRCFWTGTNPTSGSAETCWSPCKRRLVDWWPLVGKPGKLAPNYRSRIHPFYLPETPSMLRRAHALLLSLLLLLTIAAADEPKERALTDGSKAGPDFLIQGEYEGKIGENTVAGLQVIALGDGKFDAVMYAKGLPGSGADKTRVPLKGETKDGITTFTGM